MCKHLCTDEDKEKQMGGFGEPPPKGNQRGRVGLKRDLSEKVYGLSRDTCGVYGMPGFGALEGTPTSAIIPGGCQGQRPEKGEMGPGQPWGWLRRDRAYERGERRNARGMNTSEFLEAGGPSG